MSTLPDFESKVVAIGDVLERIAALPRPIVMTSGVFDIMHRGHVTYLSRARALGASLVVGVNSDSSVRRLGKGHNRPLNSDGDRACLLAALESVTVVTIFDDTVPLELIRTVRPDVYAKGGDYNLARVPEATLLWGWGARVVLIPREHEHSTTGLITRVCGG